MCADAAKIAHSELDGAANHGESDLFEQVRPIALQPD
jgi:hypothetical protein